MQIGDIYQWTDRSDNHTFTCKIYDFFKDTHVKLEILKSNWETFPAGRRYIESKRLTPQYLLIPKPPKNTRLGLIE